MISVNLAQNLFASSPGQFLSSIRIKGALIENRSPIPVAAPTNAAVINAEMGSMSFDANSDEQC